jgi:hypothetical protein
MKVALLISGQGRNAKECFPHIQRNIINPLNTDVFISTWDTSGQIPKHWHEGTIHDDCSLEELHNLYTPRVFHIEKYDDDMINTFNNVVDNLAQTTNSEKSLHMFNMMAHFYKNYQVFQAFKPYQQDYDVVVKFRFDLKPLDSLKIVNNNKINIPFQTGKHLDNSITDVMAYGKTSNMETYFSLYTALDKSIDDISKYTHFIHPEHCLYTYLTIKGLEIIRFKYYLMLRKGLI